MQPGGELRQGTYISLQGCFLGGLLHGYTNSWAGAAQKAIERHELSAVGDRVRRNGFSQSKALLTPESKTQAHIITVLFIDYSEQ